MPMENYGSVYKNIPEDGAVDNLNLARDDESLDDYESEKDSFPLRVKLLYLNSHGSINSGKIYQKIYPSNDGSGEVNRRIDKFV